MSDYKVTIEYTGNDYPVNLDKAILRAINEVLMGYDLSTNLGIDVHSDEGRTIKGVQYFEGIKLDRLL